MKGYFDVHCHILPGIDDGAADMQETLRMLEIAYAQGIRYMITTPHFHPKRGEADVAVIVSVWEQVQELVRAHFPDMRLYKGNEVYYRENATELLKEGRLHTMAGSDYVLVEFSTTVSGEQVKRAAGQIQMAGYLPVIAHIERYGELTGNYALIDELAEAGVYFQVNVGSVMGEMGGAVRRFIKKLIKKDRVHFIGTDAHDAKYRLPEMKKCAEYLSRKFDEDTAEMLLYYNPMMMVKNKMI